VLLILEVGEAVGSIGPYVERCLSRGYWGGVEQYLSRRDRGCCRSESDLIDFGSF